jgi:hypothetical protein
LAERASSCGAYNDSFSLPDTESTKAQEVLQAKFGGLASNANANILFSPETGTIQQPSVKASIDVQLEAKVKQIGSVAAVESPYTTLALPSAADQPEWRGWPNAGHLQSARQRGPTGRR